MPIKYVDLFSDDPEGTIQEQGVVSEGGAWKLPDEDVDALLRQATAEAVSYWLVFLESTMGEEYPWRTLNAPTYFSPELTPGIAAYYFVRAKYKGEEYPRFLSLCFTPEQAFTKGDKGAIVDFLRSVAKGEQEPARSLLWGIAGSKEKIRDVNGGGLTLTKFMSLGGLAWRGCRLPLDFPANTAAALYDEFCPKGGYILDPCHGWGGRLTGFYLADNPRLYIGIDPSQTAANGLEKIKLTFAKYAEKDKKAKIITKPFEKVFMGGKFDFAFTSPPYFDVEKYEGEESSWRIYKNYELWRDGFYATLFKKTYGLLKPKSVFALNVGSQTYPLVEDGKALAKKVGFKLIERRSHIVKQNTFHGTNEERGESLLIFRKE